MALNPPPRLPRITSRASFAPLHVRSVCAVSIAALIILSGTALAQAAEPTIDEIARALKEWKASWVTLRMEYERRNPEQVRHHSMDPAIREAESLEDYYFAEEWILSDDGSRRHRWRDVDGGTVVRMELNGADATNSAYFDASYRPSTSKELRLARLRIIGWVPQVRESGDGFIDFGAAFPLVPFFNVARQEWIGDSLAAGLGTLEGFEEIDGEACARISISISSLWFARQYGWLPCRFEYDTEGGGGELWTVSEFQQLENGIWFPKRGTYWLKADPAEETTRWVVTSVEINDTLDKRTFLPPRPELGTRVEDRRTGRFYTHGEQHEDPPQRQIGDTTRQNPVSNPVTADVPIWSRYGWIIGLLAVAAGLLAAGVWMSRT